MMPRKLQLSSMIRKGTMIFKRPIGTLLVMALNFLLLLLVKDLKFASRTQEPFDVKSFPGCHMKARNLFFLFALHNNYRISTGFGSGTGFNRFRAKTLRSISGLTKQDREKCLWQKL